MNGFFCKVATSKLLFSSKSSLLQVKPGDFIDTATLFYFTTIAVVCHWCLPGLVCFSTCQSSLQSWDFLINPSKYQPGPALLIFLRSAKGSQMLQPTDILFSFTSETCGAGSLSVALMLEDASTIRPTCTLLAQCMVLLWQYFVYCILVKSVNWKCIAALISKTELLTCSVLKTQRGFERRDWLQYRTMS